MKVEMIESTPNPLKTAYLSAKVCTTNDIDFYECRWEKNLQMADLRFGKDKFQTDKRKAITQMKYIVQMCVKSGHESILEHCSATFLVQGISRACSHQLVRHRLASYAQQSQRYVNQENATFVIPPSFDVDTAKRDKFIQAYTEAMQHYKDFIEKWNIKPEDARYILPEATATSIIITMNARELLHFFGLRCCSRAQWEIREMANKMLDLSEEWLPEVFDGAGAKCERAGFCTEQHTCGKYPHLRELFEAKEAVDESLHADKNPFDL